MPLLHKQRKLHKNNLPKMMKLKSKRLSRSFSRFCNGRGSRHKRDATVVETDEVKWELRPGGMLVQMRDTVGENVLEGFISIRVATVSTCHDVSIQATSTFGALKTILSTVTNFEVKEQRLLYKGKEREDKEHLHMVGVRDNDKVLLLQDPSLKERKLLGLATPIPYRIISV